MNRRTIGLAFAGIVAVAVGCSTTTETNEAIVGVQDTRKITLTRGDRISISTDASGASTITVTIAKGKRDAGTYTASDESLVDIARDARNAFGKRGVTVWIRVDGNNKIASVGWKQVI